LIFKQNYDIIKLDSDLKKNRRKSMSVVSEHVYKEAMDYYNTQYSGLGYEFAFEIKEGLNRIISFPNA
jgi:hypothetical protein